MFVKPEEKAPGEIHEQPYREICEEAKPKLSGLIRLGCRLHPQSQGAYFDGKGTCAIGAAFAASHGYASGDADAMDYALGWRGQLHERGLYLTDIYHLNDTGSTREQIAEWLESKGL